MKAGDTFYVYQDPSSGVLLDTHLWIVLSVPALNPQKVLIVSVTTWRTDGRVVVDEACELNPGDHPAIKHRSFVAYSMAKVVTDAQLEQFLRNHSLLMHQPLSAELLMRIQNSAANSIHMKMEHAEILFEQHLIEDE
jgi:hypothetical protein